MLFSNQWDRKRAEIPIYSFAKHQRQEQTTSIYSPHVLILEGIFALYDKRVLDLLDMKVRSITCLFSKHSYSRFFVKQMRILVCREEVRK